MIAVAVAARIRSGTTPGLPTGRNGADGSPPLVEHVEHVGFAEIDFYGTAARTFPVVALEVPIDSLKRHLERHALVGPADTRSNDGPTTRIR